MPLFVSKNGQRYGPYSLEELRREVLANVFRAEHFASLDEGRTWLQIRSLPEMGPLDFAVEVDSAANLLVIRYRGYVRSSAVERCAREIEKVLPKLRSGFRLLVDFTDLESMDRDCAAPLEGIMQACNAHGVDTVVRVIPNPRCDIGLRIMSFFHYGPDVFIVTCPTLAEARNILARSHQSALEPAGHPSSEPES